MAAERLSMRTIREVLRLKIEKKLSNKKIAESCNIARSTVRDYLFRAEQAGVTWPLPPDCDDNLLEQHIFPAGSVPLAGKRGMPPPEYIRKELSRKSVTLRLLWLEYKQANPDGYQYSQFCLHYHQWLDKIDVSLRQTHRAGEKLFIDYAGQTIPVTDQATGKTNDAWLFLAVWGASNYTFARAFSLRIFPHGLMPMFRRFGSSAASRRFLCRTI